ncbi:hypothetical protein ACFQHV_05965 [Promicromonospora thailandica]|uniref:hypothetical protein n=1 Tax=Promicromonospora thailandica TaxID=765201 RepID=UPI0020A460F6|nr:hypothetical protein [Promicromonospora thailandica]BFF19485.1 hypothetical protein GCM10025730_30060 [Promicromonospora thailandica]
MDAWLAAHLPVLDLSRAAVRAVGSAVARLDRARGRGAGQGAAEPDPARVAAAFGSDRLFAIDGRPVPGFAPLSGFFRTADGWVRTHANYPHHRRRLTALAGLPDDVGRDAFARRLADLPADDLEERAARRARSWRACGPSRSGGSPHRAGPRRRDRSSGSRSVSRAAARGPRGRPRVPGPWQASACSTSPGSSPGRSPHAR